MAPDSGVKPEVARFDLAKQDIDVLRHERVAAAKQVVDDHTHAPHVYRLLVLLLVVVVLLRARREAKCAIGKRMNVS